jgi:hypothetical protein
MRAPFCEIRDLITFVNLLMRRDDSPRLPVAASKQIKASWHLARGFSRA